MKVTVYISLFAAALFAFANPLNAQWVQTNGPFGSYVSSFVLINNNLFAGTNGGVYLSTNNGDSWTEVNNGLTNHSVRALAVSGTNLFAATLGDGVFRTDTNGASWVKVNNGLMNHYVYALVGQGTNLFAGTNDGVFLSTNYGTNWSRVLLSTDVISFAISGTNLFAGTFEGGIFRSTNNGTNWTEINNGLINLDIPSLVTLGTNLFAGTWGEGAFLSTNNGDSWIEVNNGLTNFDVQSFEVLEMNLFAGTGGGGVFLSINNGTNWIAVNEGLTNQNIISLIVSDIFLFVGTYDGGVWRRPLSELITSVDNSSIEMPIGFALDQNFPNPFNPSTIISYQLPVSGDVTLKVYDVLGNEVATLVNEEKPAGSYEVKFDATGLSSGIYFYKLQVGSLVETKKMLLLK
jgi:photosystem II stability/assembly factor-like uncharacterized protein